MCGRISTDYEWKEIEEEFDPDSTLAEFKPRYNVAPSQDIPVIVAGSVVFDQYSWGLIPKWAKDKKMRMINARAETVEEKPWFREAFKEFRCLIPVSSFFEWDGSKTPHLIKLKGKKIFALAGICSIWKPKDGESLSTVAVITTNANGFMKRIHGRMPVIIEKKDYGEWIDPKNKDLDELKRYLKPLGSDIFEEYEVDKKVNSAKNDAQEVVLPVGKNHQSKL